MLTFDLSWPSLGLAFYCRHLSSQSTLNSASSVKKWIPSIKNEIEYYLQVSEMLLMCKTCSAEMVSNGGEFLKFPYIQSLMFLSFPSQQSQLSHYPERKIAEFQLHIEALEKEYKSFISKLRVLDPSCKHKPWTPRAYCKRRADTQDSPCIGQCIKTHLQHTVKSCVIIEQQLLDLYF